GGTHYFSFTSDGFNASRFEKNTKTEQTPPNQEPKVGSSKDHIIIYGEGGFRHPSMAKQNLNSLSEEKTVRAPNVLERVKEEIEAIGHHPEKSRSHHHKETHGTSDDIDQNTPVDDVKGPGFFEGVKEEVEAIVNAVVTPKHSPKK
ncbi:unnamed protein product, partial [Brassica rapa]